MYDKNPPENGGFVSNLNNFNNYVKTIEKSKILLYNKKAIIKTSESELTAVVFSTTREGVFVWKS